jgi:hypothetical protein
VWRGAADRTDIADLADAVDTRGLPQADRLLSSSCKMVPVVTATSTQSPPVCIQGQHRGDALRERPRQSLITYRWLRYCRARR